MSKPLFQSIFLAALILAAAACGSSKAASPGNEPTPAGGSGGAAGSAGGASSDVHTLCASGGTGQVDVPASFGTMCAMGSNQPLCARTDDEQCGGSPCLWDKNGVKGSSAYCTIECDPAKENPCPARFTCKSQGCDDLGPPSVCVRTEADPPTGGDCSDSVEVPGRAMVSEALVQAADGRLYVMAVAHYPEAYLVISKMPTDTGWTKIYEGLAVKGGSWGNTLVTPDAVYYHLDSGHLLRLAGTQVTAETYEACSSPSSCDYRITSFLRSTTGQIRAFTTEPGLLLERGDNGTWAASTPQVTRTFQLVYAFATGGAVGTCVPATSGTKSGTPSLCVSTDGVAVDDLALPGSEVLFNNSTEPPVAGESLDDFYLLASSGTLYHHLGSQTLEEGLPVPSKPIKNGRVVRLSDGTLYASVEQQDYRLDGGCWRPIDSFVQESVVLGDQQIAFLGGYNKVCKASAP